MPLGAGLQLPARGFGTQQLDRGLVEGQPPTSGRIGHRLRLPDPEEPGGPVAGGLDSTADPHHRLAEADRLGHRLVDQPAALRAVHHRGGDVQGGDHRIQRRGGAVHHQHLVEPSCSTGARGAGLMCTMALCDSAASSLWVDWVAKTVGRSGPGKVSGPPTCRSARRRGGGNGRRRTRPRRSGPGGCWPRAPRAAWSGVVAQAVIGGVGEHRVLGLRRERATRQRVSLDTGGHRLRLDLARGQRPGQPVAVARGDQIDRPGAGDDQTVEHRLVAVPVHQGDLVTGDAEVADQAVAGGVAVEDEVA